MWYWGKDGHKESLSRIGSPKIHMYIYWRVFSTNGFRTTDHSYAGKEKEKMNINSYTEYKNQLGSQNTCKLSQESIWENLYDLGLGKYFLNRTQKNHVL